MLHIGGQGRVAARMLSEASSRAPGDQVIRQARTSLADPWPTASGVLLDGVWRTAPSAWGVTVSEMARVVGSGVLIDGGATALVPTQVLDGASRVWVRNGLGQTAEATVEHRLGGVPLTRLRLRPSLQAPHPMRNAAREPFGGSPNYTVEYTPGDSTGAAWPLLRQGFFGSVSRDDGLRPLGIDVPSGPRGGPVFDRAGQLVGIAVVDDAGVNRVVFASRLGGDSGDAEVDTPSPSAVAMAVDELYERGLLAALQLIRLELR